MTLLARLKALITTTLTDQQIVDNILVPSLDKMAEYVTNYKYAEVVVNNNTKTYNLTSVLPTSGGVQDLIDVAGDGGLYYLQDYYFSDKTTLFFVKNSPDGTMQLTYNSFFTKPVLTPTYIETDCPVIYWNVVLDYAVALFNYNTSTLMTNGSVVTERQEANIRIKYSDQQIETLSKNLEIAEARMKAEGLKRKQYRYLDVQII
jgi:hypothetical protein